MTDIERVKIFEQMAAERDVARELCRDALAERDKARACESTALGLLASMAAELEMMQLRHDSAMRIVGAAREAWRLACEEGDPREMDEVLGCTFSGPKTAVERRAAAVRP